MPLKIELRTERGAVQMTEQEAAKIVQKAMQHIRQDASGSLRDVKNEVVGGWEWKVEKR